MGYRILFVPGRFITVRDRQQNTIEAFQINSLDFLGNWCFLAFCSYLMLSVAGWRHSKLNFLNFFFKIHFLKQEKLSQFLWGKVLLFPSFREEGLESWRWGLVCSPAKLLMWLSSLASESCTTKLPLVVLLPFQVHKGISVTQKCLFMALQVSIAFGLVTRASECVQDFCWVNNTY